MTLDKRPITGDETAINSKNSSLGIDGKSDRESIKKLGNINDVIQREKIISRDKDELFSTKLHLSSWTINLVDIIMINNNLTSERKMYQSCLSLGTIFLEDNMKEVISAQRKLRTEIIMDNNILKAFLASRHSPITISGDPIINVQPVTISMPHWVRDGIGSMSEFSGVKVSTLRRLSVYYALGTANDIPDYYKKELDSAIKIFESNVLEVLDIFKTLGGKNV